MQKNCRSRVRFAWRSLKRKKCLLIKRNRVISAARMISNHLASVRKFLWIWCAVVTLVVGLIAAPRIVYARQTTQFEALPLVRSRQNHLLVRAFINGKPAWLTVDSGAPVSAIALHRREYFRLKPTTTRPKLTARAQINGPLNNLAIAQEPRIRCLVLIAGPVVTVQ